MSDVGEAIVLKESGLVLTRTSCGDFEFHTADGTVWVVLHVFRDSCVAKLSATRDPMRKGTRDECIAWLDARVLALRAALTPPGHALVGMDARETVALAVATYEGRKVEDLDDDDYGEIDAILAALGVRGGPRMCA